MLTVEEKVDLIFETLLVNGMLIESAEQTLTRNKIYPIEERLDAIGRRFQGETKILPKESPENNRENRRRQKKTFEWLRVYLQKAYRRGKVGNPLEWEELAEEMWVEIKRTIGPQVILLYIVPERLNNRV